MKIVRTYWFNLFID